MTNKKRPGADLAANDRNKYIAIKGGWVRVVQPPRLPNGSRFFLSCALRHESGMLSFALQVDPDTGTCRAYIPPWTQKVLLPSGGLPARKSIRQLRREINGG